MCFFTVTYKSDENVYFDRVAAYRRNHEKNTVLCTGDNCSSRYDGYCLLLPRTGA